MSGETLILGIGNPILTDDAVGLYAVRELEKLRNQSECVQDLLSGIDLKEFVEGGISFIDAIAGYRCVILIDAIQTEGGMPGDISFFCLDQLGARPTGNPHSVNARTALELGRYCGYALPEHIYVYSVEAADCHTFSMTLSPVVRNSFPVLIRKILADLNTGLCAVGAGLTQVSG